MIHPGVRWRLRIAPVSVEPLSRTGFRGHELSVVWNSYLDRSLMTYTDGWGDGASIREAAAPWGPWSDALTLVSSADVPDLYAPFMLPKYTANHGRTIYFTLSKWGPYNVFWYRPDLVKKGDG